ncbi:hypothetical protein JCM10207_005953 [Rhodosporidiobolus poonsookiae]
MSAVLSQLPELPTLLEPASTINGKPVRLPKPRVSLGPVTSNNLGTVRKLHACLFPVAYSPSFFTALLDPSLTPEQYTQLVYYQDLPVGIVVCRLEPSDKPCPESLAQAAGGAKVDGEKGADEQAGKPSKLYVMTLGVLAPYRRQGLALKLIHHVLTTATESLAAPLLIPAASSSAASPVASTSSAPVAGPSNSGKKGKKPPPPPAQPKKGDAADKDKKDEKGEAAEPLQPRVESVYLHVQVGNDDARRFWEKWGFEVKDTVRDYYRKLSPRDAWLLERKVVPSA